MPHWFGDFNKDLLHFGYNKFNSYLSSLIVVGGVVKSLYPEPITGSTYKKFAYSIYPQIRKSCQS